MKINEGDLLICKKSNWDIGLTKGDLYLLELDSVGLYVSLGYSKLYLEGNEKIFNEYLAKHKEDNFPSALYVVIYTERGGTFLLGSYKTEGKATTAMKNSKKQNELRVWNNKNDRKYFIKRYVLEELF